MPVITNTYTAANLLNWTEESNTLNWSNEGSHTVTTPGGNGTLLVEGNGSIEEDSAVDTFTVISNSTGSVDYRGEIDISNIPLDAVIQQVVIRLAGESAGEAETTCQGNSVVGSGNCTILANTNANNSASLTFTNVPFSPFLSVGHLETDNSSDSDNSNIALTPIAAGATAATDDSDEITFLEPEFVNLGLSLADFILQEYNILNVSASAGGNVNATITFTGGGTHNGKTGTASGAVASHVEITDWEFDITFFTEDVDTPLVEETQDGGYEFGGSHGSETPPVDVVIVIDISGIYFLDPTATHDTFYIRDGEQGTIDLKIPRPFARTAYLGD